jgi:hypothetical protein
MMERISQIKKPLLSTLFIFVGLSILFSWISSCNPEPTPPICANDVNIDGEGIILQCLGSDTFHIDSTFAAPAYFSSSFEINGKEFLGISNMNDGNKIHFIEFENPANRFDIPLGMNEMGRVRSFDLQDSLLYIYTRGVPDSNQLHIVGLSGVYHRAIRYSSYFTFEDVLSDSIDVENTDFQHIFAFQDSPLQIDDSNRLFFPINHNLLTRDVSSILYLDLNTGEVSNVPVKIPPDYFLQKPGGNGTYYLPMINVAPPFCYISFPASGDIYRWEIHGGGSITHVMVESKHLPNLKRPPLNLTGDPKSPYGDNSLLELNNGRYGKLIRIENSDLFVRLIFHADNKGDTKDFITNRKGSLMVMDSNFAILGGTGIINGVTPGGIFSRLDGTIYLQDMRATDDSLRANGSLVFQKIKIKKL